MKTFAARRWRNLAVLAVLCAVVTPLLSGSNGACTAVDFTSLPVLAICDNTPCARSIEVPTIEIVSSKLDEAASCALNPTATLLCGPSPEKVSAFCPVLSCRCRSASCLSIVPTD